MILSIILSSALSDEEDDQRAEQQDADSERCDGQQNACGDSALLVVGKTGLDIIRQCAGNRISIVNRIIFIINFSGNFGSDSVDLFIILGSLGNSVCNAVGKSLDRNI